MSDLFLMYLDVLKFVGLPGKVAAKERKSTSCGGARCSVCTSIKTKAAILSCNSECAGSHGVVISLDCTLNSSSKYACPYSRLHPCRLLNSDIFSEIVFRSWTAFMGRSTS